MDTKENATQDELIAAFHRTWDTFPGPARLIDNKHNIQESNPSAEKLGFTSGAICAKVGDPKSHRGCKMSLMFKTGLPQTDQVISGRVRGWIPVKGFPDFCIHFTLPIPENN